MYLLGYDCGTSSIKATLLDAQTSRVVASATAPEKEMAVTANQPGWAEQDPNHWWQNLIAATNKIKAESGIDLADVTAIGIAYQMHGLVLVDDKQQLLRPSIIWCDNRAVEIGQQATEQLGQQQCLQRLLNLPGNFTMTRLKWVQENEPDIYRKIHHAMLPGDYLAMKMTGQVRTTPSGLSEWIGWDFSKAAPAQFLMQHLGIDPNLLPDLVPTFAVQGELTKTAAAELSLKAGTKITYRAGDQPNNAFSLNVLSPGEIATTAGTSAVVYGIADQPNYDEQSRVNTFIHVNHTAQTPRYGTLMCINGAGCLNSWLKHNVMSPGEDYPQMNQLAQSAPVGSDNLVILPYGNSAERTLANRDLSAQISGLQFNRHSRAHLLRAAQEGIVFAMNYGLNIMRQMNIEIKTVRAGHANMFLSELFSRAFATVTDTQVELYNTDGSQGAARGAGLGDGIYQNPSEAFTGLKSTKSFDPDTKLAEQYQHAYKKWESTLKKELEKNN